MSRLLDVDLRPRRPLRWLRPLTVGLLAAAILVAAGALAERESVLRASEAALLQSQAASASAAAETGSPSSVDPAAVAGERLVLAGELNTRLLAVERCATDAVRAESFRHDSQAARSELTIQAASVVAMDEFRECLNAGDGSEQWSVSAVESRSVGGQTPRLVAQLVVLATVHPAVVKEIQK